MSSWTIIGFAPDFAFDSCRTSQEWYRLHKGDQEPLPVNAKVLSAWALYHGGNFEAAAQAGLKAGPAGTTVANKATAIYATFVEGSERTKLDLFQLVASRAAMQVKLEPDNANAHYHLAYALGRYSQGISVAKAMAKGLGGKIKSALETAIRLQPAHADAMVALGTFHAEVIDKVGVLIGSMTYGVKKEVSLQLFEKALALNPDSPVSLIEYANALVMLEGDTRAEEATALYERAASMQALDASDQLEIELAQTELAD